MTIDSRKRDSFGEFSTGSLLECVGLGTVNENLLFGKKG